MGGLDGVVSLIAGLAYDDPTCPFSMRRLPIHFVRQRFYRKQPLLKV
jgi:hypothetical protein